MSTNLEVSKGHDGEQIAKTTVVAQIRRALLDTLDHVGAIDNIPDAAALWKAVVDIKRDLSTIERAVNERLVNLTPIETFKYRGEYRTRPVREQPVEGVGMVKIGQTATRDWGDGAKREKLAHAMYSVWRDTWASMNDGEYPSDTDAIGWVFDVFAVGDPRTTALQQMGLGHFDATDETGDGEWVTKSYAQSVRVD